MVDFFVVLFFIVCGDCDKMLGSVYDLKKMVMVLLLLLDSCNDVEKFKKVLNVLKVFEDVFEIVWEFVVIEVYFDKFVFYVKGMKFWCICFSKLILCCKGWCCILGVMDFLFVIECF